jgi:hypothetical protein
VNVSSAADIPSPGTRQLVVAPALWAAQVAVKKVKHEHKADKALGEKSGKPPEKRAKIDGSGVAKSDELSAVVRVRALAACAIAPPPCDARCPMTAQLIAMHRAA